MIKIKIGNEYKSIPDNWNDISVGLFQKTFLPVLQGTKGYESIASVILPDMDKIADEATLAKVLKAFEFFKTEITKNEDAIVINKKTYTLTPADKITYLQAIAIEGRKNNDPNDMSGFISVLLPEKFEEFDYDIAEAVKELPITLFWGSYVAWFTFMGNMSKQFKELFKKKLVESTAEALIKSKMGTESMQQSTRSSKN